MSVGPRGLKLGSDGKGQRDVAEQIGVNTTSVFKWEANTAASEIRYMPVFIRFGGYNPLLEARALAEQLVRHRTCLGLSQKAAALELDVDPSTLARWEQGEREPKGILLGRVERLLQNGEASNARRAGWAEASSRAGPTIPELSEFPGCRQPCTSVSRA